MFIWYRNSFLVSGRLTPNQHVLLRDGELIHLGSEQVCFRVTIR